MRKQLRPFYTDEERAKVYAKRYDHTQWEDHRMRILHTANRLREMHPQSVADLSCGDGAIVTKSGVPLSCPVYFGDITPGWEYTGPIEKTVQRCPFVDVFVLSETLEHVEDPDLVLRLIRGTAERLLLTTPCGEIDNRNPEHYWGWDTDSLREMLTDAQWEPQSVELYTPAVPDPYYTFQIWRCE